MNDHLDIENQIFFILFPNFHRKSLILFLTTSPAHNDKGENPNTTLRLFSPIYWNSHHILVVTQPPYIGQFLLTLGFFNLKLGDIFIFNVLIGHLIT